MRHDELSKRITAEIEGLYHISSNFHIGLHLNYLHNRNYFPFYTFYLEQHQEWQPFGSSVDAPVVNDITVYEPLFQLGVCLRYELKFKRKGEDDLTQP